MPSSPPAYSDIESPTAAASRPAGYLNGGGAFHGDAGTHPCIGVTAGPVPARIDRPPVLERLTFATQCSTISPYDQLQQLTISASAPGATDQLNFVVADPNYVFPPRW